MFCILNLIRYMVGKYFLTFRRLLFHFCSVFNSMKCSYSFYIFSCVIIAYSGRSSTISFGFVRAGPVSFAFSCQAMEILS